MGGISHWLKTRFQTFDLLAEYFTAAMQGAVDVLWGVALPFLAWMVYSLFKTPAPWINWLAILSALFLAGYYVWRADHVRLIPKLAVRDSRLLNTPITLNGSVYDQRTFVQLVPTCLTEAPVYECVAYLQNVQRLGGNGWEDTTLDKNLILNWATEHHPQAEQPLNVFLSNIEPIKLSLVFHLVRIFRGQNLTMYSRESPREQHFGSISRSHTPIGLAGIMKVSLNLCVLA
jgi:hypothetical protein